MAHGSAKSTGQITTSQVIVSRPGLLCSFSVFTDGTNQANATLYDNTSASGKVMWPAKVAGATLYGGRNWPTNGFAEFENGLYLSISGTGASAIVEYV